MTGHCCDVETGCAELPDPCVCPCRGCKDAEMRDGVESVRCPECGHENGDLWDHEWGSLEDLVTSCGECGREFVLIRHVSVRYEARPMRNPT